MFAKRLTEYLTSAEGLVKSATSLLVLLLAFSAKLTDYLGRVLVAVGVPKNRVDVATNVVSLLLLLVASFLLWRGYRRFRRESRVVRPEAFILAPATPGTLVGRDDDLENLHKLVRNHRIVLLDGESGCGKSALLKAGLAPELRAADGLFPVLVQDWGEDPVRGPLAGTLGALHDATDPEQRARLGWHQPDLAADAASLHDALAARLRAFAEGVHRTPLLIADQLDDYQARHRTAFIGEQGAWIAPDALTAANPFWSLIRDQLTSGSLHLLAVSRSDLASGLSCFRFLPGDRIALYPLPKVELSFLHKLMDGIAPPSAERPIVSNPENGWNDLRDRLETDFRFRGAVLMQQVRTVLLGVAQLPVVTPRAYRRAGGMPGMETLVIRRALEAAAGPVGGGAAGLRAARALLGALVLEPGPDQVPKAQRQPLAILAILAGGPAPASAALAVLAAREIVRPAGGDGAEPAWQLDHDYLARAVLAEARAADRWGTSLAEGLARFRNAGDGSRTRWRALLPMGTQACLLWERLRGRLRYGEAASYAGLSAIKPLLALVLLATLAGGGVAARREFVMDGLARALAERFTTAPAVTVMQVWAAPPAERAHLLAFLTRSNLISAAITAGWAAAHAGADPAQAALAAPLIRLNVADPDESKRSSKASSAYIGLVHRLGPGRTAELTLLANQITGAPAAPGPAARLAAVFAAAAPLAQDQGTVQAGALAIRRRLQSATDPADRTSLANSYADTAAALDSQTSGVELDAGIAALDDALPATKDIEIAFAILALQRNQPAVLAKAARLLRARMSKETGKWNAIDGKEIGNTYGDVLARLSDGQPLQAELSALRECLLTDLDDGRREAFAAAFVTAVARVKDTAFLRVETQKLIGGLSESGRDDADLTVAPAVIATAARLVAGGDPDPAYRAAYALADRLKGESRD